MNKFKSKYGRIKKLVASERLNIKYKFNASSSLIKLVVINCCLILIEVISWISKQTIFQKVLDRELKVFQRENEKCLLWNSGSFFLVEL